MDLLDKVDNSSLSVGEFLAIAQQAVEDHLPARWISGEVANFVRAASGHWYFSLRDEQAQVDCVMMARQNVLVQPALADGEAIAVMAQASVYVPRGRFQLRVRFVRRSGAGRLYQLLAKHRGEWAARGWFAATAKKTLPAWPHTIGIVGSLKGAAVRDVLRTLKVRMPSLHVIIYPAPAQGAAAAEKIAAAIQTANSRAECETLIVCRGGGGIEDLWAFNEEAVVAAIVNSRLPVVCGIGHELDETLADLAADMRAPTPTGAAMLASPDRHALQKRLQISTRSFYRAAARTLEEHTQKLDWAAATLHNPAMFVRLQQKLQTVTHKLRRPQLPAPQLQNAAGRLSRAAAQCWQKKDFQVQQAFAVLAAHHPQKILSRGYSIVKNAAGNIITDGGAVAAGDKINMVFAQGGASAKILQATGGKKAG